MIRVIAGTAKSIQLETAAGTRVRPTLDRVREAAFSILMPRLEGCRFADCFAGSGANGIEALSRGAAHCVFVDHDRHCLDIVERNLAKTRLDPKATCHRLKLPQGMAQLSVLEPPFDLVYADPPFDFSEYEAFLAGLLQHGLLNAQATVVIEHAADGPLPDGVRSLTRTRQATYGTVSLSFFS
jgi:16S rRNA (guanine(966)-N(2))-methyltransferase RsmD